MLYVIKKDGTREEFNPQKIVAAVNKSAERILYTFSDEEKDFICRFAQEHADSLGKNEIEIQEMHNIVEGALERVNPAVAKSYRDYRNYKLDFIHMMDDVYTKSQAIRYIGDKSNANTDSALVATKRSLIFNELNKELYRKFFMNRNELRSLDLATKIYKRKERIALAEMLPNVALAANYFVTNPNVFNGFKNDFAGMFNVGVMVKVPLSGWWEGTYRRNSAKAETRIKTLEWQDAREKIELQVNQSVYKVNEAGKKLIASSRNMENAEENLRRANFGFEEGVIPALNLMEAQTAWVSARSSLIDAQIEVKLTEVYLSKALGKLSANE